MIFTVATRHLKLAAVMIISDGDEFRFLIRIETCGHEKYGRGFGDFHEFHME